MRPWSDHHCQASCSAKVAIAASNQQSPKAPCLGCHEGFWHWTAGQQRQNCTQDAKYLVPLSCKLEIHWTQQTTFNKFDQIVFKTKSVGWKHMKTFDRALSTRHSYTRITLLRCHATSILRCPALEQAHLRILGLGKRTTWSVIFWGPSDPTNLDQAFWHIWYDSFWPMMTYTCLLFIDFWCTCGLSCPLSYLRPASPSVGWEGLSPFCLQKSIARTQVTVEAPAKLLVTQSKGHTDLLNGIMSIILLFWVMWHWNNMLSSEGMISYIFNCHQIQ